MKGKNKLNRHETSPNDIIFFEIIDYIIALKRVVLCVFFVASYGVRIPSQRH